MTLDEIVAALPSLDSKGLKTVIALATQLDAASGDASSNEDPLLFPAMVEIIRKFGIMSPPPLTVIQKKYGKALIDGAFTAVNSYVDQYLKPKSRVHRKKAYHIIVNACCVNLRSMNIPVTLKTVLQRMGNVHEVMETAFPGYLNSNLMHVVLDTSVIDERV